MKSLIIMYASNLVLFVINIITTCIYGATLEGEVCGWTCAILWCIVSIIIISKELKREKKIMKELKNKGRVLNEMNSKMTKEECEKSKGFHITITDIDTKNIIIDEEVVAIIGSIVNKEDGKGKSFELSNCNVLKRMAMLNQLDEIREKVEKAIVKSLLDLKE